MASAEDIVDFVHHVATTDNFYSPSKNAFFNSVINAGGIPEDAVLLTVEEYLIATQSGKPIKPGEDGKPVLIDDDQSYEWHKQNAKLHRNSLLSQSDWVVAAANERGESVSVEWQEYRQKLRDYQNIEGYPYIEKMAWPQEPRF